MPRNILLVSNYPSDTGYAWWLMEHFWLHLANIFIANGGKAYLAYPSISGLPDAIANSQIETVELTVPWTTPKERQDALSFIEDKEIDALYLTDQPWFNPKYFAMRSHGVRTIVVHDHTPGDRPPITGIKGMFKAFRNRVPGLCADYTFVVSPLMRERSLLNARIPNHCCIVIQNGIPDHIPSMPAAEIRQQLGISSSSIVVVNTGRVHPYKRPDFVIRVAAAVTAKRPDLDFQVLLIGDGPAMTELQVLVRSLVIGHHVQLLGFRRDTRDILAAADIAIHAALGEGFALSIIEYMSAGLPVLVPDIPSVKQAIEDQVTGLVYDRDDIDQAANLLIELIQNTEQRNSMGVAARRAAESCYTLERCTNLFLDACNKAFQLSY